MNCEKERISKERSLFRAATGRSYENTERDVTAIHRPVISLKLLKSERMGGFNFLREKLFLSPPFSAAT